MLGPGIESVYYYMLHNRLTTPHTAIIKLRYLKPGQVEWVDRLITAHVINK